MGAELCGWLGWDGQKDEALILSSSDQEVGGNQEKALWKPTGGVPDHESCSHLQGS